METHTRRHATGALRHGAVLLLLLALLLSACAKEKSVADAMGEAIPMRYASLLRMARTDSFTTVDIADAWHPDRTLHRYVLVPKGSPLPTQRPEGTLVRTPLERAVVFTSVHAALLDELGELASVAGLCDTEYVIQPRLKARVTELNLGDMGSSMQPNTEKIVGAKSDALLVSPFKDNTYGAIEKLGIPLIECADYMETSPLGRAEWMRFYGLLFGCGERADSLFEAIEEEYEKMAEAAKAEKRQPTVMVDKRMGSAWMVPGGKSTMARLFADAGMKYVFADNGESGSISVSMEQMFARAEKADLWLLKYGAPQPLTYGELLREDARHAVFRPWKERRIYACNTLLTPFYEETPFHPERLLRDMVKIAHPMLFKTAVTYYKALP